MLSYSYVFQDLEDLLTANFDQMVEKWNRRDSLSATLNFSHRKIVLHQRVRMADTRTDIGKNFILNVAKRARKECDFNFADACLALIKKEKPTCTELFEMKVMLEEARVLWQRGETHVAR